MKKILKRTLALCVAGITAAMMSLAVSAVNAYNTNDGTNPSSPLSDTTSFTFTKHYTLVGDTTDGASPAENFSVTFTPFAVANIPESAAITTANMPTISTLTLPAALGAADTDNATNVTATVTLPTYTAVGDYWYKVNETAGSTAGVTYDDNDYYLHVQVIHASDDSDDLYRLVTLHTNAPASDGTPTSAGDNKNDGIANTYSNGSLSVKKVVQGNMGDLTKEYEATVVFTYPSADSANCPVKSSITYTDGTAKTVAADDWTYDTALSAWKATKTLSLSNNETVTFENIPYGVNYTVTETDYSADGYTHTFAFADNDTNTDTVTAESAGDWNSAKATGSISDAVDDLTITNEKESTIDVGVLVENAPFIGIFAVVIAVAVIFVITRRRKAMLK